MARRRYVIPIYHTGSMSNTETGEKFNCTTVNEQKMEKSQEEYA